MLANTYIVLLIIAFVAAKMGVIDRTVEMVTMPLSMILFAAVAFASYGIDVPTGNGMATVSEQGLFVLCLGLSLVMLVYTVLAAIGRLPEPDVESLAEQAQR